MSSSMLPNSQTLTEEEIISLVGSMTRNKPHHGLIVGIGDDAAVLAPTSDEVCVTTDLMVEGVHFDFAYTSPRDLGHRAMAANLSDLASMGAHPKWGFLSLGLPAAPQRNFVEEIMAGLMDLGQTHGLVLAGGDTVRSPVTLLNLCLMGTAPPGGSLLRSGASPGNLVCVTGALGSAMAGLSWLQAGNDPLDPVAIEAVTAHLRPVPRVEAGLALASSGMVTAMMDVSDGLATDLARMCRSSRSGALLHSSKLPVTSATREIARAMGAEPLDWALTGGEDFELLYTCRPENAGRLADLLFESIGVRQSVVGEIVEQPGVFLAQQNGNLKEIGMTGFDHFKGEGR